MTPAIEKLREAIAEAEPWEILSALGEMGFGNFDDYGRITRENNGTMPSDDAKLCVIASIARAS